MTYIMKIKNPYIDSTLRSFTVQLCPGGKSY